MARCARALAAAATAIITAPPATGMPFVAPPEVPGDRVEVLRKAFITMARDKTPAAPNIMTHDWR